MPRLLSVTTVSVTHARFLLPYARHFRALGWRVDGLAAGLTDCEPCRQAYDQVFDIEWSRNPFDPRNLTRASRRVREIVQAGQYDIVHVHTPVAAFVTRFALRSLRRNERLQVIYTAHGFHFHRNGHPLKNAAFLSLEKLAGPWTDFLVVINHEDEDAARKHRIVPSDRVRYMPGIGVDLSSYHPQGVSAAQLQQLRQELKLGEEQKLFTMIAGFEPRKRHQDVLAALAYLQDSRAVVAFAGTGPLESEMKALAQELGVLPQVRFLGFRRDIPALLMLSRASILPSEREGLSRSIMESMAMGVPVIATDAKGNRDLLQDGGGVLVPIGDAPALARALKRLLDHPDEARDMGERARQRIQTFDLQRIIAMHETLYAEALQQRKQP